MTREEFYYQCIDVIEHWLNGNRKLSDLREVTDKLYDEVTKPHWISVEDEMPKIGWAMSGRLGFCDITEKKGFEFGKTVRSYRIDSKWYDKKEDFIKALKNFAFGPQKPMKGGKK